MIRLKMNLRKVIERKFAMVQEICQERYGCAPELVVDGDTNSTFPYFELPLEYMLPELLKNAARATVEKHQALGRLEAEFPPVRSTIAVEEDCFTIRIQDEGNGIAKDEVKRVMDYNYSTAEKSIQKQMDADIFGGMMEAANRTTAGPMHGYS